MGQYTPRIGSDPEYIKDLGQAFYNFTYLEWGIIWLIAKLRPTYFTEIENAKPQKTAGRIRQDLVRSTAASVAIDAPTRAKLVAIADRFGDMTRLRNLLLHAHPFTDQDGAQRLGGLSHGTRKTWTADEVQEAARAFEEAAVEANDILHNHLNHL